MDLWNQLQLHASHELPWAKLRVQSTVFRYQCPPIWSHIDISAICDLICSTYPMQGHGETDSTIWWHVINSALGRAGQMKKVIQTYMLISFCHSNGGHLGSHLGLWLLVITLATIGTVCSNRFLDPHNVIFATKVRFLTAYLSKLWAQMSFCHSNGGHFGSDLGFWLLVIILATIGVLKSIPRPS